LIDPDVAAGDPIPERVKVATRRQLVQYAGASGDFYEMHYDDEFARSTGLPGVILHGLLKAAFLGEMLTRWADPNAELVDLQVRYNSTDVPGRPLRSRGVVTSRESGLIQAEIWIEDPDGVRTTTGSAVLRLK
jgi:acyl dehydratase